MPKLRELFSDPKKAITAVGCLLVALATLGAVIFYIVYVLSQPPAAQDPGPSAGVSAGPGEEADLGLEEARETVLADAGLDASQVSFSQEALVEAEGTAPRLYLFRFKSWNVRYEYQINAETGAIYSKVKEITATPAPSVPPTAEPTATPAPEPTEPPPAQTASQPPESAPDGAELERAKAAALADAGVSAEQAAFTKAAPDYEDGQLVYEVEFYTSTHEYEYEIDGRTGAVLSRSAEVLQTALPSDSSGSAHIGMARAKASALEHAGLTDSQVRFTHVGMDREDGRVVYEVEFRQGNAEYEYKIDAETGRILSHERDGG